MKKKPVDKKLLRVWRNKMYDTTYETISQNTNLSMPTLRCAIKYGRASKTTIDKLILFFNNIAA